MALPGHPVPRGCHRVALDCHVSSRNNDLGNLAAAVRYRAQMYREFKEFVTRGNVFDLAVGIVIGAAFGKIINSLVNDVVMPPLGMAVRHVDFKELFVNLSPIPYQTLAEAKAAGAPTINYGIFVNTILEFFLVAFAVFLLIRTVNRVRAKSEAAPATQDCPYCRTSIPLAATRCPNCTSDLKAMSPAA